MHARVLVTIGALIALASACGRPAPRPPCTTGPPLGTVCGFENPEDIAYVSALQLLVASNMRMHNMGGFLSVMPLGGTPSRVWPTGASDSVAPTRGIGDDSCQPPNQSALAPHGIYADQRDPNQTRLYVVNHGGRESIEIFRLERAASGAVATWLACIVLPRDTSANDVAVSPDGEVIASNYVPSPNSLVGNIRFLLGMRTGDVLAWKAGRGWQHVANTAASGANGVEVSADGRWLYYAATGGGSINKISRDGTAPPRSMPVPGLPDNLAWTSRGTLLLATHESISGFLSCVRTLPCRSPWRLFEVDPNTLQITERFRHDGDLIGAVAGAQEVGDAIYVSPVFGDRIGVLRTTK